MIYKSLMRQVLPRIWLGCKFFKFLLFLISAFASHKIIRKLKIAYKKTLSLRGKTGRFKKCLRQNQGHQMRLTYTKT